MNTVGSSTISPDGEGNWLFWLAILVIIFIIILFAYVFNYGSPDGRRFQISRGKQPVRDQQSDFHDREEADRIERLYLAWITIASIFLASAIIIKGFVADSIYYSIIFFIIVILILVIANVDYLNERKALLEANIPTFPRLDYLFFIVTFVIFVAIFIIYDILRRDKGLKGTFFNP